MKQKRIGIDLTLRPQDIDECSDKIGEYLSSLGTDKKEAMRIRLSAEEALLKWQARFGETKTVRLMCYSLFGQPMVRLRLAEDPFNPLESEEGNAWSQKLMAGLQTTPMYSYESNANIVTFKLIRKRISPLVLIGIALAAAVRFVVLAYFMAVEYGVEVSLQWFIITVLMSLILSVSVPAIPGGILMFGPLFFSQLGIPAAAATAMLATDFFFDAPTTAFCQVAAELALVQQAGKTEGMLDEDALRK